MSDGKKNFGSLYHPNSAWSRADKARRARARVNQMKYAADRRSMEDWARAGFRSTMGGDDTETRTRHESDEPESAS